MPERHRRASSRNIRSDSDAAVSQANATRRNRSPHDQDRHRHRSRRQREELAVDPNFRSKSDIQNANYISPKRERHDRNRGNDACVLRENKSKKSGRLSHCMPEDHEESHRSSRARRKRKETKRMEPHCDVTREKQERRITHCQSRSASMDSFMRDRRKENDSRPHDREAPERSKHSAIEHKSADSDSVSTSSLVRHGRREQLRTIDRNEIQCLLRSRSRGQARKRKERSATQNDGKDSSRIRSSTRSSKHSRRKSNALESPLFMNASHIGCGQLMLHPQMLMHQQAVMQQHMMACAFYSQQQLIQSRLTAGDVKIDSSKDEGGISHDTALACLGEDGGAKPKMRKRKSRWGPEEPTAVASVKQSIAARLELKKRTGISSLALSAMAAAQARKFSAPTKSLASEPVPEKLGGEFWEVPRCNAGLKLLGDLAPSGTDWRYVMQDESRRSFVGFLPKALGNEACSYLFEKIKSETIWQQPRGANGPIPRKTCWMVAHGCTCTYRYGGITVAPQVYPTWMKELMHEILPKCGLGQVDDWPSCCNLNLYEDGASSVGWHADDEALFQGKFHDCRIISFSLGTARKFEVRLNWPQLGEKSLVNLLLGDGDMCTMEGMTQKHAQHRVPREPGIVGSRINLTWRWVVKHTPSCPASRCRL